VKGAGSEHVDLGVKEVLRIRANLIKEAKELGFEELRITGQRAEGSSSALKGKLVDQTIDLTKE
jgi:hypothetical protein